jgi:hypothetical protein
LQSKKEMRRPTALLGIPSASALASALPTTSAPTDAAALRSIITFAPASGMGPSGMGPSGTGAGVLAHFVTPTASPPRGVRPAADTPGIELLLNRFDNAPREYLQCSRTHSTRSTPPYCKAFASVCCVPQEQ